MSFDELWLKIKSEYKQEVNEEVFLELFDNAAVVSFDNNYLTVIVNSAWAVKRLNNLHLPRLNVIGSEIYGSKIGFKFLTKESYDEIEKIKRNNEIEKENIPNYTNTNLSANFIFSNFIIGKSNKYAYNMALKTAEQPGILANPLYIFGGVGLGKTHLMQSIGNYVLETDINKKIIYIKADDFVEEYVSHIRMKNLMPFNRKFRDADVLLVDDIQMLSNAEKSQSEFFRIFDHLKNNNKQIVITSDKPTKDLNNIMERLTSRFNEGLVINIDIPDEEHRIDILKYELQTQFRPDTHPKISDECLKYIAKTFTNNIRELKGALQRAMSYCEFNNLNYTPNDFAQALKILVTSQTISNSINENAYERIKSVVANYYKISVDDLIGNDRTYNKVTARHVAMYLIKSLYNVPYKKIGDIFNGRDHSTVMNACSKINKEAKKDQILRKALENVIKKINE